MAAVKNHDLNLPEWGPYNKEYVGFSHIADAQRGLRFDLDLFPGYYRRSVMFTRTIADGGAKLWRSSADLKHMVYRYELEHKDKVYCDVHFVQKDGNAEISCEFVNNTERPQSVQMDFCASVRLPGFIRRKMLAADASVPEGNLWVKAAEYDEIEGCHRISMDGFRLGEWLKNGACGATAFQTSVITDEDGFVSYSFAPVQADALVLRYCAENDVTIRIQAFPGDGREHAAQSAGGEQNGALSADKAQRVLTAELSASTELTTCQIELPAGEYEGIRIYPCGQELELDGFAIGMEAQQLTITQRPQVYVPELTREESRLTITYPGLAPYVLEWDAKDYVVRELLGEDDFNILADNIHEHVSHCLKGKGEGHFTDLFVRPVFVKPHTSEKFKLKIYTNEKREKIPAKKVFEFAPNPCGETYLNSQNLMSAAMFLNVVYPVYFRGKYLRHNTPGKIWDSFYTWDSGFIALGLMPLDKERAVGCLNTYLMPEGDRHMPYLNHGSPVPTQMFLYKELMDAGEEKICRDFYPSMRYYYRYFAGLGRGKNGLKSGLVSTWHIFYNSGGWDDYPAQSYVHKNKLTGRVAPMINTSVTILMGRILRSAAAWLGFEEDLAEYDGDIAFLTENLQQAWDEETGYFGYAEHDETGAFTGVLRNGDGVNVNMGFDGIYPLIAGAGNEVQKKAMMENIKKGLLTKYGVSVVDTRAPYFSSSGYWNGSIWMPHQWILWKAMLDCGDDIFAEKIAMTALNLWKTETDDNYNCYEHFMLENGRGAGFHHFSGLSAPVVVWYSAYFVPGHVSAGFRTVIRGQKWNREKTALDLAIETDVSKCSIIVTLKEGGEYRFDFIKGKGTVKKVHPGTYVIRLKNCSAAKLKIGPCQE